MEFEIHKSRGMDDVYNKVDCWLKNEDIVPSTIQFKNFNLFHRGKELIRSDSLIRAGIFTDADI